MLKTRDLSDLMGTEVLDVDLAEEIDDQTLIQILRVFGQRKVLVFRNQQLSPGRYLAFAKCFGHPFAHVLSQHRLPDFPEILVLSNIYENGKPIGVHDGAAYWHTDSSYQAEPASATFLYSLKAPNVGGETIFADMYRAYDALPKAMKTRLEGKVAIHKFNNRDVPEGERESTRRLTDEQRRTVPPMMHNLVKRHPVTGRKALYGVAGHSFGILGVPDVEAVALLDELKEHCIRQEFRYIHRHETGDLMLWDTYSTLHKACLIDPATGPDDSRHLLRIIVRSLPPLAAELMHPAAE